MKRRDFLRSTGIVSASLVFAKPGRIFASDAAVERWRTFEVTTRAQILKPSGTTRVWLPAPLIQETPFQKTLSVKYQPEGGAAKMIESKPDALGIIAADFPSGVSPVLTFTSQVATKNYAVDLSAPGKAANASSADLQYFLRPTKLLPTDGIVKTTATEITSNAKTDVEKARAIYQWVVDNTFRDPKTRGCGVGDIRLMLETKDLGGKCADLNALYVGLARAAGLPARDVYGIRVGQIRIGIQEPGRFHRDHHKIAALPRGGLPQRLWLGTGRSRRRAQSCAGRTARESPSGRRYGEERPRAAVRFVGNELDGLQLWA
jgi:transglutaminase-like putative cysteine protease